MECQRKIAENTEDRRNRKKILKAKWMKSSHVVKAKAFVIC